MIDDMKAEDHDRLRSAARDGIDAVHASLSGSDLVTPAMIMMPCEKSSVFYQFTFTYGPLRGFISARLSGLVRPDFDIAVDDHEPYNGLPFLVQNAKFSDEEARSMLVADVMKFLEECRESHVFVKSSRKC